MSETYSIILTSAVTIIGGVLIYVLGQIISKLYIEPIHEQAKCIGEITCDLMFYANYYSNPGTGKPEVLDEVSEALRQKASLLNARSYMIKSYGFFAVFGFIPKKSNIAKATRALIGLSNCIHKGEPTENQERRKIVEKALNIKTE